MVEIRILDEKKDEDLLRTAWDWGLNTPAWFRDSLSTHKESLKSFLDSANNELLVGIFENEDIISVVRFVPLGDIYDLHLMAKRGTNYDVLFQACLSIKQYVFANGFKKLSGWIPKRNRSIVRLYHQLGFRHQGLVCYQGKIHGKAALWLHFECEKH